MGQDHVNMCLPEDHSSLVSSTIHVEGTDGLREFLKWEISEEQKSEVDEVSGGAGINEGSGFDGLLSDKY